MQFMSVVSQSRLTSVPERTGECTPNIRRHGSGRRDDANGTGKSWRGRNSWELNPIKPGNVMNTTAGLKTENLVAIDTHVHIESDGGHEVNEAARKYFGATGDVPSGPAIAEYYRSRKIACVVFSVDERLTGRRQIPNDEVAALAGGHQH